MEITKDVVLRAWRDEEYNNGLPEDVRKQIPARPTGDNGAPLTDAELEQAAGGTVIAGVTVFAGGAGGLAAGFGVGELID